MGHSRDINKNDNNNIYLFLLNKYSAKISGKKFYEVIQEIGECKKEEQYNKLTLEEQNKLIVKLLAVR